MGNGSGSRSCSPLPSGITNLYYGCRSHPTLAQASPVIGPKMCSHHNNYRQEWSSCRLASMVQLINILTHSIHHISRCCNPIVEHMCCYGSADIGKTYEDWQLCRTSIVTFADASKYIGFFNTSQLDKRDKYKSSVQDDLQTYVSKSNNDSIRSYVLSNLDVAIGKPTTCAYQFINFVNDETDGCVYQFFLYDGLKIAIRINDFACKTFYGHHAMHRTALPLIVRNNKVYYRDDDISIFAWGKS